MVRIAAATTRPAIRGPPTSWLQEGERKLEIADLAPPVILGAVVTPPVPFAVMYKERFV